MIKFLNQLSERDKAAAIKFLIATLKQSTKEYFNGWPEEDDGHIWFDSKRIFARKTSSTLSTIVHPNQTNNNNVCNALVSIKNEINSDTKWFINAPGPSISLAALTQVGNFSKALIPCALERKRLVTSAHRLEHCRNSGSPFYRDIRIVVGLDDHEIDFLKVFLNNYIFDHTSDDRSLVRLHRQVSHLKPEATITEIKDDDVMDVDDTTQKSSEDSLQDGIIDSEKIIKSPPRKRKLYKCFQCPKL